MIIPWHQTQQPLTQRLPMPAIMITLYLALVICLVQVQLRMMEMLLQPMILHLLQGPIHQVPAQT